MKNRPTLRLLSISLAVFLLASTAPAQEAKPDIASFSWMAGCWELNVKQAGMTITEQWMKPAGQSLIGMARTVKGDKTIAYEFLRIVQNEAGISYIAKPSQAKEETAFKLVKSGKNEAIFENLAHDFPQRIIYRSDKADSMAARIESGDAKKGMDIPMTRVKCE